MKYEILYTCPDTLSFYADYARSKRAADRLAAALRAAGYIDVEIRRSK